MFINFECTEQGCPKNDLLSWLTVAVALVPEAVAFAFVASVEPLVGLYAAFMVVLIESLLTLSLIDEITETRGRGNRECVGQGIAITVTSFFGGMGGCAMISHSAIEAIDSLAERYLNAKKRLHLRHLSEDGTLLLKKAGDLVEVNVIEDPRYRIADDQIA